MGWDLWIVRVEGGSDLFAQEQRRLDALRLRMKAFFFVFTIYSTPLTEPVGFFRFQVSKPKPNWTENFLIDFFLQFDFFGYFFSVFLLTHNTEEESVGRGGVYNGFYRWNHRRIHSVGDSIDDSGGDNVMSLYGYLSLNPSVIPSIKSSEKAPRHHTIASFLTKCIVRRRYGRYIPTDFETEFSPSVITTDEIFLSVILLVFSGFLVVIGLYLRWIFTIN
jgi:hypothetical protein